MNIIVYPIRLKWKVKDKTWAGGYDMYVTFDTIASTESCEISMGDPWPGDYDNFYFGSSGICSKRDFDMQISSPRVILYFFVFSTSKPDLSFCKFFSLGLWGCSPTP